MRLPNKLGVCRVKMKLSAGAVALLFAGPAAAQRAGPSIEAPCVLQTNGDCLPVSATNPLPVTGAGGSSGPTVATQGSTTSGQTGTLAQGAVVTGNQVYTSGTTQPLNLTPSGRLKVGLSSSSNIAPATIQTTTLESELVGCIYRATPPTWTDQFTGAVSCDATGRVLTTGNDTVTGTVTANLGTIAGVATATNQATQITAEQATQANTNALAANLAVASGATDAGNPLEIGGYASSSFPSAVTNGQRTRAWFNGNGAAMVAPTTANTPVNATATTMFGGFFSNVPSGSIFPMVGSFVYNGSTMDITPGSSLGAYTIPQPVATASAGIAPTGSDGATAAVLKAAPGNLYSVNEVNSTVAHFLVAINATTAPTSGTATPVGTASGNRMYCMPVAASVGFRDTFNPPLNASVGITLLASTSCTTYTPVATPPVALVGQAK